MDATDEATSFPSSGSPAVGASERVAGLLSEDPGRGWEVVTPGAGSSSFDDCSIFPPSLHEGLHLRPDTLPTPTPSFPPRKQDQVVAEASSGPTSYPVPTEANPTPRRPLSDSARRLIGSGLVVIHEKIALCRGGLGHLAGGRVWSLAAVVGFVGAFMYMRRRMHRREKELLHLLIQEKDQRIRELLNQIALMNHIASARQQVSIRRHA